MQENRSFPWVKVILASAVSIVLVLAVGAVVVVGGAGVLGVGLWGMLVSNDADRARAEARYAREAAAATEKDAKKAATIYEQALKDVTDVAVKSITAPNIIAANALIEDCGSDSECVIVTCDVRNSGGTAGGATVSLAVAPCVGEEGGLTATEDVWLEPGGRTKVSHQFECNAYTAAANCVPNAF